MRHLLLLLALPLALGCASGPPALSSAAPATRRAVDLPLDYRALQGVWTVARAQRGAVPMPDKAGTRMFFEGNRFWFQGDRGFEVIEIDVGVVPHRIDFWSGRSVILGIFRIDGDTLSICTAPPGDERPADFDPSQEPRQILSESRRS